MLGNSCLKVYNFTMQRVLIQISYNGSLFYGWQRQKDRRSVQGEIESALTELLGKETLIVGSSRTDCGVHALFQCAHFDCDESFPADKFPVALNSVLPDDIKILSAKKVKSDFSARYNVKKKTYVYALALGESNPLFNSLCCYTKYDLDLEKAKQCLDLLKGKHNFKGFSASGAQVKNFERELYVAKLTKKKNLLLFTFTGNGFMQHMVRILVGTVVDVARGNKSLDDVKEALETGNRAKAGKTMPPNGLYLKRIYFN